jgi:hypothetical protein
LREVDIHDFSCLFFIAPLLHLENAGALDLFSASIKRAGTDRQSKKIAIIPQLLSVRLASWRQAEEHSCIIPFASEKEKDDAPWLGWPDRLPENPLVPFPCLLPSRIVAVLVEMAASRKW